MCSEYPPIKPSSFKGNYYEYGLYLHNWYRERHGAPPLKLAKWMNESGDNYCEKLARHGGALVHSSGLGYGENLWGGPQAKAYIKHLWPESADDYMHKCAVREAVKAWYKEVEHYNYNHGGFSMHTGHFTAMVWKSSTELGIGVCVLGGTIIVAGCYKVHPNMQGQFTQNVLRYRHISDVTEDTKAVDAPKPVESVPAGDGGTPPPAPVEVDDIKDAGGVPDENATVVDNTSPEMKLAFDQVCDANDTIGWYELKDLIVGCIDVGENSVAWDKVICRMLIKAVGDSVSERIGFLGFENAINGLKRSMENFVAVDKDRSGNLDPFEVKNAFSRDRDISYEDVIGLMEAVGKENGKMSLYGFLLADLLLITLSTSDVGIDEDDNPAVLEWMNKQVDFLKSGKPLKDM